MAAQQDEEYEKTPELKPQAPTQRTFSTVRANIPDFSLDRLNNNDYLPEDRPDVSREWQQSIGAYNSMLYPFGRPLKVQNNRIVLDNLYAIERSELPEEWRSIQLLNVLGSGVFGIVALCVSQRLDKRDPQHINLRKFHCAVKVMEIDSDLLQTTFEDVVKEATAIESVGKVYGYKCYACFAAKGKVIMRDDAERDVYFGIIITNRMRINLLELMGEINSDEKWRSTVQNILLPQIRDQMALFWLKTGRVLHDRQKKNFMLRMPKKKDIKSGVSKMRVIMIDLDMSQSLEFHSDLIKDMNLKIPKRAKGLFVKMPVIIQDEINKALNTEFENIEDWAYSVNVAIGIDDQ